MTTFKFEITTANPCNYVGFHDKYAGPKIVSALNHLFNYGGIADDTHAIVNAGAFLEFPPVSDAFDFYIRLTNSNLADCADFMRILNEKIAPLVDMPDVSIYADCEKSSKGAELRQLRLCQYLC